MIHLLFFLPYRIPIVFLLKSSNGFSYLACSMVENGGADLQHLLMESGRCYSAFRVPTVPNLSNRYVPNSSTPVRVDLLAMLTILSQQMVKRMVLLLVLEMAMRPKTLCLLLRCLTQRDGEFLRHIRMPCTLPVSGKSCPRCSYAELRPWIFRCL